MVLVNYPQSVDGKNVFLALLSYLLVTRFDEVIEKYQCLVHVPVVLSVIVQPLPYMKKRLKINRDKVFFL